MITGKLSLLVGIKEIRFIMSSVIVETWRKEELEIEKNLHVLAVVERT